MSVYSQIRREAPDTFMNTGIDLITLFKVLADVPCSTDRLAVSFDEGNIFSAKHTQERLNLPQLQMNILV